MKRLSLLITLLICAPACYAQFMVDTVSMVQVTAKAVKPLKQFSTFNKKLIGGGSGVHMLPTAGSHHSHIAMKFVNPKGKHKVRIDSVSIKSSPFDTNKVKLSLSLYYDGKLGKKSGIRDVIKEGKTSTFKLVEPFELPPGESYIAYSFFMEEATDFFIYTNNKINGHFYSYNAEKNEFKIIDSGDAPAGTPQMTLYYTTIWDE